MGILPSGRDEADQYVGARAQTRKEMRSQKVEALEIVEGDLRYARSYYDSWRADGGSYFQDQFRDTISWIEWNPELFPKRYKFFRRAIVRNTYFGIFFAIEPDVTTVVAVVDMRQRPAALRKLLRARR